MDLGVFPTAPPGLGVGFEFCMAVVVIIVVVDDDDDDDDDDVALFWLVPTTGKKENLCLFFFSFFGRVSDVPPTRVRFSDPN